MIVILLRPFSYSLNGNDVIDIPAGEADIPDRFIAGLESNNLIKKASKPARNKAKKKPVNKAK